MLALLQDFLNHCRRERGLSRTTVSGYHDSGRQFLNWFTEDFGRTPTLDDWTEPNARAFLAAQKIKGIRQSTRRGRVAALRSWGAWMVEKGTAPVNPWLKLKTPVNEEQRQPCPSADTVRLLLEAADRLPNRRKGLMAKTAIALLSMAGLRLFELLALHRADVHTESSEPYVLIRNGKGGKAGVQPLPRLACQIVNEWLAVRGETNCPNLIFLSGNKRGDRAYTHDAFYNLLPLLKSVALIQDEDLTAHALRRFGGTSVAQQQGASLADAQKFLRQSSMTTTLRYIKPTGQLRKFVEGILPSGGDKPGTPAPSEPEKTIRFVTRIQKK